MSFVRSWLPLLLAVVLPLGARAFSVADHEALTEAALEAALAAGHLPRLAEHRAAVVEGSRAEDLNLHVKWTGWHHFFRPGGSLDSGTRRDSATRVRALWAQAEEAASHGDLARAFDRVGHLVHHLQDMAVPMHVVPVMHGLTDRFEQRGVRRALEHRTGRAVAPLSGEEAQLALALETLEAVRTGTLSAEGGAIPWSAFWAEPSQPGTFGAYGEAGNAFGDEVVRWGARAWRVERAAYEAFLEARVEGAVAYTRAFLTWATERLTALAEARASTPRPEWRPSPEFTLELGGGLVHTSRGATPLAGARGLMPLPWSMALSLGVTQALGARAQAGGGGWTLGLLSPPLLTARPGYAWGMELRAMFGAGLFSQEGTRHLGVPLGLRARALLKDRISLSAEAQYQPLAPVTAPWARGASLTLGVGFTWGDR
jgi:hypothetical protein